MNTGINLTEVNCYSATLQRSHTIISELSYWRPTNTDTLYVVMIETQTWLVQAVSKTQPVITT